MENDKKVDISTKIRHYFLFSKLATKECNIPDQGRERLRRSLVAFLITLAMLKTQHSAQITGCLCQRAPLRRKTCLLRSCSAASFSLRHTFTKGIKKWCLDVTANYRNQEKQ